jgi:hypothetical protein
MFSKVYNYFFKDIENNLVENLKKTEVDIELSEKETCTEEIKDEKIIYCKTDNNACCLKTTNNILLDLFVNIGRDLSEEDLNNYMTDAMKENPQKTIAIIFNSRDRKNGKKEKTISNNALLWLKHNNWLKTYKKNLNNYIDLYGCWKDIFYILENDSYDNEIEMNVVVEQLLKDRKKLINEGEVSLCAKWSPSENKHYDKKGNIGWKIANRLLTAEFIKNELTEDDYYKYSENRQYEYYRKRFLSPLRKKINIVESLMCKNEWNKINYETVPGVASKRLKNSFMKHDEERYKMYLNDVKSGTKKINVTGILPHELVNYYLANENNEVDMTIENQWDTIVKTVKDTGIFNNTIAVVDVSGSMFSANNGSIPAQVSIALGLLISEICEGLFKKKVITFSEKAEIFSVKGETLKEKIESIKSMDWGYNTNLENVSELIVDYGKENKLERNDMPNKIVILSDMQFDEAIEKSDNKLMHTLFVKKFTDNDYNVPQMIYWNLNYDNTKSFPISKNETGTALLSGFSEQLLKMFMENEEFTPDMILDSILESYMKNVKIDKTELEKNK